MNNALLEKTAAGGPTPFDGYREKAAERFGELGIPASGNESYKYTPLDKEFFAASLAYNARRENGGLAVTPEGVISGSLRAFAAQYGGMFSRFFNTLAGEEEDAMIALNTALCSGGNVVYIPKNTKIRETIQLTLHGDNHHDNEYGQRDLFIFENGSDARLLIRRDGTPSVFNRVCEVFVLPEAHAEIIEENTGDAAGKSVESLLVAQYGSSTFRHTTVTARKGLCRNNIRVNLKEPGAECHLYGVVVAGKGAHTDNSTVIRHLAERCTSFEHYKNIGTADGTAVFSGSILVAEHAQKTEAYQKNNNILLSGDAVVHTRPQLVIYADDVRCSHGATVGQLDGEALFYMRQRGIPEAEAQRLLLGGFIAEITGKIGDERLRESCTNKISEHV